MGLFPGYSTLILQCKEKRTVRKAHCKESAPYSKESTPYSTESSPYSTESAPYRKESAPSVRKAHKLGKQSEQRT